MRLLTRPTRRNYRRHEMLDQVSFKKLASFSNHVKYAFESRDKDIDGVPIYSYIYLGNEKDMFVIFYRGNVIAQIRKESDVRDFIQEHNKSNHGTISRCSECSRVFDLTDQMDLEEYIYGHDCEVK